MLQRTISYKSLLRIIGVCFLLYGFYLIVLVLTSQIEVTGDYHYSGALIFENPIAVRNYIFFGSMFPGNPLLPFPVLLSGLLTFGPLAPSPLLWVSVGMLWLSITSTHVKVMYMCLQTSLWLISLSVWFPIFFLLGFTDYEFGSFVPFMLVTLTLSLVLLAFYKPVIQLLRKLFTSTRIVPIAKA